MNRNEFLEELKKNNIWSEKFQKDYMDFTDYQNSIIGCLKEFHRICEKNQILYELAWGSLLGAIRDNGIIPWDYDVDVFVPFSQRQKLIEVLNNELNENYYFYCIEVNEKCRHFYMRIAPKGFNCEVLHLDVFFLIGVPNDIERDYFARRIVRLTYIHSDKLMKLNLNTRHPKLICERLIKKIIYSGYRIKKLREEYFSLCGKESVFLTKECVTGDAFATDCVFPQEALYPTILYNTEFGEFRVPHDYKQVLELMYRNYSVVPPLNNRIDEIKINLHRLKKWSRK